MKVVPNVTIRVLILGDVDKVINWYFFMDKVAFTRKKLSPIFYIMQLSRQRYEISFNVKTLMIKVQRI